MRFSLVVMLVLVAGCSKTYNTYVTNHYGDTASGSDDTDPGDTALFDTALPVMDTADDSGTTSALVSVIVQQKPFLGERVYSATDGELADWLDIEIQNPYEVGIRLQELLVIVYSDDDGGENGMDGAFDTATRMQDCYLYTEADNLAADIIRVGEYGIESVLLKPYDEQIGAGESKDYFVACQRDPGLGVPESGEFYSLTLPTYGVVVTDLSNQSTAAQTLDLDGNPGDINATPDTWAAYYPE